MTLAYKTFYTILFLLAFLAGPPIDSAAQKKKKTEDTAQGLRMREAEFYFTEGEKYFILEDYAKALLYYQRAMEINPTNATIHYKIAEVLSQSNKQDDLVKASASIEHALRLEKSNKYFYLLAANIYNGLARFGDAAQKYEEMLRQIPNTEKYLFELAAVYQYANKPEAAIAVYDKAEKLYGINEISSIQKARLFFESGKTREGLAEGEKLIRAFPDEERFIMAFTELLSQRNMQQEAIAHLEKFIDLNQHAGGAKMLLAGFYRDVQQEEKARPLLVSLFEDASVDVNSKIIILSAYNAELHQHKLNRLPDSDKEKFATSLFEKLATRHPDNTNVAVVGGDLYLSVNRLSDAQQQYSKAVSTGEVSYEVWENLLYLDVQLEQWDSALSHAEEALERYPNQRMVHYFYGYANYRKRRFEECIVAFEQAKKIGQSDPRLVAEMNGMLGDAYNATKNYIRADQAYEEALTHNPDNAVVLNNYSFSLALRKENLDKAEKMSSTLIKNHPDNPTFLDTHAWVLYMKGRYKDARKVIEKAVATGKANAAHFEHYGDILYKLGDVDGAVAQWEKARSMNANSETLNKKIANRKIYE